MVAAEFRFACFDTMVERKKATSESCTESWLGSKVATYLKYASWLSLVSDPLGDLLYAIKLRKRRDYKSPRKEAILTPY